MQITVFKSKIHRARVTEANLNYEGSVTLDPKLMMLAKIREYEAVHIWNVSNGNRLITYAIRDVDEKGNGRDGSGRVCINGAAAHLMKEGDIVIIATFMNAKEKELEWDYAPIVVHVDDNNKLTRVVDSFKHKRR